MIPHRAPNIRLQTWPAGGRYRQPTRYLPLLFSYSTFFYGSFRLPAIRRMFSKTFFNLYQNHTRFTQSCQSCPHLQKKNIGRSSLQSAGKIGQSPPDFPLTDALRAKRRSPKRNARKPHQSRKILSILLPFASSSISLSR